jgi:fumarate hydratase class I
MSNAYRPKFPLGPDQTPYRKLSGEGVRVERALGADMLVVDREAIRRLSEQALIDINHLLRPGHLAQLAGILDDAEATSNDKFVAFDLLKNANIAAGGILPMCQDTGTAIVVAKKGRRVWTEGDDEGAIAEGIGDAYEKKNLR